MDLSLEAFTNRLAEQFSGVKGVEVIGLAADGRRFS